MFKYLVKAIFIQRILCGIIASTPFLDVYGFVVYGDGSFKVEQGDVPVVKPYVTNSFMPRGSEGQFRFDITDGRGNRCDIKGDPSLQGDRYTSAELTAGTGTIFRQQVRTYIVDRKLIQFRKCHFLSSGEPLSILIMQNGTDLVNIGSQDSLQSAIWSLHSIIPELPDAPPSCTANMPVIEFGLIPETISDLQRSVPVTVSCTKNVTITITANHGLDYTDSASGTVLNFTPHGSTICNRSCSIPISVRMIKRPARPGKYTWQVPVVLDIQ